MKNGQRLVTRIRKALPVSNPVIRSPQRQHTAIFIEVVVLLSESVNHLICSQLISEIDREYLPIRAKPEGQLSGADLRHLFSRRVMEGDRERSAVEYDVAFAGFD